MNTLLSEYHKCKDSSTFQISKDKLYVFCNCGFTTTISIKECVNQMKNNTVNNIELNEIGYDLQKGNEHLNSYFKSLKNKHISHLIETINEIESAYDQSYQRNVNIL